jgi:hypothetical protein
MAACTEEAVSFFCALQQSGQVERLYQPDSSSSSSPPDLVYSAPQPTSYSCQVSQPKVYRYLRGERTQFIC